MKIRNHDKYVSDSSVTSTTYVMSYDVFLEKDETIDTFIKLTKIPKREITVIDKSTLHVKEHDLKGFDKLEKRLSKLDKNDNNIFDKVKETLKKLYPTNKTENDNNFDNNVNQSSLRNKVDNLKLEMEVLENQSNEYKTENMELKKENKKLNDKLFTLTMKPYKEYLSSGQIEIIKTLVEVEPSKLDNINLILNELNINEDQYGIKNYLSEATLHQKNYSKDVCEMIKAIKDKYDLTIEEKKILFNPINNFNVNSVTHLSYEYVVAGNLKRIKLANCSIETYELSRIFIQHYGSSKYFIKALNDVCGIENEIEESDE